MWTKIKVHACYTVKIYKNNPPFFFQTGGRAFGITKTFLHKTYNKIVKRQELYNLKTPSRESIFRGRMLQSSAVLYKTPSHRVYDYCEEMLTTN